MPERILSLTCPHCKYGIKHDTLLNRTTVTPPEEYPAINEYGRCWCKACQHGTYPNEDGLCSECSDKGRGTRLRPKGETLKTPSLIAGEDLEDVVVEDAYKNSVALTVDKVEEEIEPVPFKEKKKVKVQKTNKPKVLR